MSSVQMNLCFITRIFVLISVISVVKVDAGMTAAEFFAKQSLCSTAKSAWTCSVMMEKRMNILSSIGLTRQQMLRDSNTLKCTCSFSASRYLSRSNLYLECHVWSLYSRHKRARFMNGIICSGGCGYPMSNVRFWTCGSLRLLSTLSVCKMSILFWQKSTQRNSAV